jgi:hypothetical protein
MIFITICKWKHTIIIFIYSNMLCIKNKFFKYIILISFIGKNKSNCTLKIQKRHLNINAKSNQKKQNK